MAAGDDLMHDDGADKLDVDGVDLLDDGAGNTCGCGCGGGGTITCSACGVCCYSNDSYVEMVGKPTIPGEVNDPADLTGYLKWLFNHSFSIQLDKEPVAPDTAWSWRSSPFESGGQTWRLAVRAKKLCDGPGFDGTGWILLAYEQVFIDDEWIDGNSVWYPDDTDSEDDDAPVGNCCGSTWPDWVDPWAGALHPDEPVGIAVKNNKCCRCSGGDCQPTSDGADSACDGAGENTCGTDQDDDCNPLPG